MRHVPAIVICIASVSVTILLALLLLRIFQKRKDVESHRRNRDAAGILFGAVSLIYSLILAFVLIAVWEDYEGLNTTIEKEADKLKSILTHTELLPDSLRNDIRDRVFTYTRHVLDTEWHAGQVRSKGNLSAIPGLRRFLLTHQPQNYTEQKIMDALDDDLDNISDLRRERLSHHRSHVPDLVWFILICGSCLVIYFSYFLSTDEPRLHRTWVGLLAAIIAVSLCLVFLLDHPFRADTGVRRAPFEEVLEAPR